MLLVGVLEGEARSTGGYLFHDAGFALGKGDVTSGLVLNEFDLDLASAGLLVGLWLLVVVIVVCAALASVVVLDEGVVCAGDLLCGVEGVEALTFVGGGGWIGRSHLGDTRKGSRDWLRGVGIGRRVGERVFEGSWRLQWMAKGHAHEASYWGA